MHTDSPPQCTQKNPGKHLWCKIPPSIFQYQSFNKKMVRPDHLWSLEKRLNWLYYMDGTNTALKLHSTSRLVKREGVATLTHRGGEVRRWVKNSVIFRIGMVVEKIMQPHFWESHVCTWHVCCPKTYFGQQTWHVCCPAISTLFFIFKKVIFFTSNFFFLLKHRSAPGGGSCEEAESLILERGWVKYLYVKKER